MANDFRIGSLLLLSLLFAGFLFFGCTSQANPSTTTTIESPSSTPVATPTATPTPAHTTTSTVASTTTVQQTTTTAAPTATPAPTTTQLAVKEFTMTARQFSFSPNSITVNKGDHVRIHITSTDVTHGFSLPDFGISLTLTPGSEQIADFTANKAGSFSFFCNVFCGSGHSGMTGQLIVTG